MICASKEYSLWVQVGYDPSAASKAARAVKGESSGAAGEGAIPRQVYLIYHNIAYLQYEM